MSMILNSICIVAIILSGLLRYNVTDIKTGCFDNKEQGFIKIKSHQICIEDYSNENKNTFRVYFTSGQRYKLNLCDANHLGEKMLVSLMDKKDHEIATNFNNDKKGPTRQLIFECKKSGTYYLQFAFQNKTKGCGIAQLFVDTHLKSAL
jgi:hypothetical protein